jgi:hypothetical protein
MGPFDLDANSSRIIASRKPDEQSIPRVARRSGRCPRAAASGVRACGGPVVPAVPGIGDDCERQERGVSIPLTRLDGQIYEYACHEGNYGMPGMLKGARTLEKGGK